MNKKFLLSTIFTLMSWQGVFAADLNSLGSPEVLAKPKVSTTMQPQGPFVGNMVPDTMGRILSHLSFKEGWKFLGVNAVHHENIAVWTVFASIHGTSTGGISTAEKIRGEVIIDFHKNALRAEVLSGEAGTSELMTNFFQRAQKKPFLWGPLIDALPERMCPTMKNLSLRVLEKWVFVMDNPQETFNIGTESWNKVFSEVPAHLRIACFHEVAKKTELQYGYAASPDERDVQRLLIERAVKGDGLFAGISREERLTFLGNMAEYKTRKGNPTLYAQDVQSVLTKAANRGEGVFAGISPEECLAYLKNIAERINSEGESTLYAQYVQCVLTGEAARGSGIFAGISREERLAFLENIAERINSEGKSTPYARHVQREILGSAGCGGIFTGVSREEVRVYMETVAVRTNHDGSLTPYARHAQHMLLWDAWHGIAVFAGIFREERFAYVKKKSEQGILRGMSAEEVLKKLQ